MKENWFKAGLLVFGAAGLCIVIIATFVMPIKAEACTQAEIKYYGSIWISTADDADKIHNLIKQLKTTTGDEYKLKEIQQDIFYKTQLILANSEKINYACLGEIHKDLPRFYRIYFLIGIQMLAEGIMFSDGPTIKEGVLRQNKYVDWFNANVKNKLGMGTQ